MSTGEPRLDRGSPALLPAGGIGRYCPEIDVPAVDVQGLLRRPGISHAEGMRDNTGARFEFAKQRGPQLLVESRKQVERNDSGFTDIGFEEIRKQELHLVAYVGLLKVVVSFLDALGIDIDSNATRPVFLRGRDRYAAVSGTE